MVPKPGIILLYIGKFMKVFMDIYEENCWRVNNFVKQKIKFIHIFYLTLIMRTLNGKYLFKCKLNSRK